MAASKGRADVQRYIAQLPQLLATKVLPSAGRAAGNIVADEARVRTSIEEVRENIVVRVNTRDGRIVVRITVKPGWGRTLGIWEEYGTDPHFIRVDDEQRAGRSAGRINRLDRAAADEGRAGPGHALRIGGNFVTGTVRHPGAKKHPFLRTSLDLKQGEAIAAAQSTINTRIARLRRAGLIGEEDADQ